MGWYEVEDIEQRSKYLGSWANDPNIILYTRYGKEFFAGFDIEKSPKTGEPCHGEYSNGMHDFLYMTGPHHNDHGGFVCLEGSLWDDKTKETSCDQFAPLKCRYCGEVYNPQC